MRKTLHAWNATGRKLFSTTSASLLILAIIVIPATASGQGQEAQHEHRHGTSEAQSPAEQGSMMDDDCHAMMTEQEQLADRRLAMDEKMDGFSPPSTRRPARPRSRP